ncbi:MAG: hypothetical protein ACKKL4_00940 [Patescibacteria group bacterium]
MNSRSNSNFLKVLIQLFAWILVLSAFGVTIGDIVSFNWLGTVAEMLIKFFTI